MQILLIESSPHKHGSSNLLAERFMEGAKEAGDQTEGFDAARADLHPCLGCGTCGMAGPCVQKDDFNGIAVKLREADLIAFASPLYFWTISSRLKAFIERFYCLAQEDPNPPLGRYEKYPEKDCVLLMTAADDFFWTFEQAVSYYRFAIVNYIGFHDKGMLLAGGCGDTNGGPRIEETEHLKEAYMFGKGLYD